MLAIVSRGLRAGALPLRIGPTIDRGKPVAMRRHWRKCVLVRIDNSYTLVEPQERNLLINPAHPAYGQIEVVIENANFSFYPRLF